MKGWGICAHCHGNHTERGGRGGCCPAPLRRCKTPTASDLGPPVGGLEATGGECGVAGQVSLPPGDPGTGIRPGPVGAAGTGGQRTLSVRTCQKYQAEIRATTPTHAAKNSWCWMAEAGWGGGFPTGSLACCPASWVAWLGTDESISLAGQLRPRQGRSLAHSLRKGTFKYDRRLCQAGPVSSKTNQ